MPEVDDALRKERIEHAKACMDRVVETYKARMAFWTFLAVAMLTLTGVAVQNRKEEILYLAAFIPFFALFVELAIKYGYSTPFLYRAVRIEFELYGADATSLGLLCFAGKDRSEYEAILTETDEVERQYRFRRVYVFRAIVPKIAMCATGCILEILLAGLIK